MPDQRTLVVVGTGVVAGTPDQCVLHLSLNSMGNTAGEALNLCAAAAESAIAAAVQAGVNRDDTRTVNLSVNDFFDKDQGKVTARVGSYQLDIIVRRLDRVPEVLDAVASAAGDALQIRGLSLGIGDPEPLRREARRQAVQTAQEKAHDLAEAAGVQLGTLMALEDNEGPGTASRVVKLARPAVRESVTMPVEPGQVSVSASVTLTYSISD